MPAPPVPSAPPARTRSPGLLAALADTRFRTLATPIIVMWIYRGCLTLIVTTTLWWVLVAAWVTTLRNGWLWGALGIITAPILGVVLALIVRVGCEFILIRFRAGTTPAPTGPTGAKSVDT